MQTTRLAPSPTGALHLGNARTFALTWLWARSSGARLVFRLEDIDSPRKKPGAVEQLYEDLRWLGLDWEGDVLVQSARHDAHVRALEDLVARRLVYPCICTRRDVESAQSAPHAEDEWRYPGACRGRFASIADAFATSGRPIAIRFAVGNEAVAFDDAIHGPVTRDPAMDGGDFVLARWDPSAGWAPGYQLSVVLDDAHQGVDVVIRGDDLVPSTPRQILVQRALALPPVRYTHLPLVVGPDGRRLAKRHGDTRIAAYREAGVHPGRIRSWIEKSASLEPGTLDRPRAAGFDWSRLPRARVVVPAHAASDGPPEPVFAA